MQVYKVPKLYVIYKFALASFVCLIGLVLPFVPTVNHKAPMSNIWEGLPLWVVWLGLCVWIWYGLLCKGPLEVGWEDEGSLVFRSVIGSNKIAVRDIISIKEEGSLGGIPVIKIRHPKTTMRQTISSMWLGGVPVIKTRNTVGSINIMGGLTGFDELLGRILTINPTVELSLFNPYLSRD